MAQVLRPLENTPVTEHPDLIVGIGGADDAAVFRIDADTAIAQTVDFFTPIVDDAYDWGRIAAANALSDIYAMGATPAIALQIAGWPRDSLPMDLLAEVFAGGADILRRARCTLVGGHSIDDQEPKYGLAVTGLAHPARIVTNGNAKPGDFLVLTKPLGSGILATAIKRDLASPDQQREVVDMMTALNAGAASVMTSIGVHSAT
ncbi:MAG: selenide, water dikinase SelD, partial [Acidimicrobiia bacterium]|nr:selenide, water dikinase SelD [Acidimicrobiia bacterium]